jgi:predicted SAM-dependent methyltransferase
MNSETSLCREYLSKYCKGAGLDLGFGGDPISPTSIAIDLETPTTIVGRSPQHLRGDARSLYWFNDAVLDYVYSSHLLEDFTRLELPVVLKEWLRVIKPGGFLVLYCPNQILYLKYCLKNRAIPNGAHKITEFGLTYLTGILQAHFQGQYLIVESNEPVEIYSFDLVLRKL